MGIEARTTELGWLVRDGTAERLNETEAADRRDGARWRLRLRASMMFLNRDAAASPLITDYCLVRVIRRAPSPYVKNA